MTLSSGELITIIFAMAAALVSVINAIANGWGRKEAKDAAVGAAIAASEAKTAATDAHEKLDVIHTLTNSNMTAVKMQLDLAMNRIGVLEGLLKVEKEKGIDNGKEGK